MYSLCRSGLSPHITEYKNLLGPLRSFPVNVESKQNMPLFTKWFRLNLRAKLLFVCV